MPASKAAQAARDRKMTSEERLIRHLRAQRKFKALVWLVMSNRFWLQEQEEDEEIGEDVKKNVALLMKKKKDKNSLLTKQDKIILCKRQDLRTPEEKIHLHKLIGSLKCFRKYPQVVQERLAAVTYFMYFPPNRIVVKQGREGLGLYFIITGEVSVSITAPDPVLKEIRTDVVGTMVAGQMFGEISLLHNIPRTATITTISHVELLCLLKDDFEEVLKDTLQARWNKILLSLDRFEYFDFYDEVARRECCTYSKMKTYRQDQIIYGEKESSKNYAFFVMKGQCRLVEKLNVVEYDRRGTLSYRLFKKEIYRAQQASSKQSIKESLSGIPEPKSFISKTIPSIKNVKTMKSAKISRGSVGTKECIKISGSGLIIPSVPSLTGSLKMASKSMPSYVGKKFVERSTDISSLLVEEASIEQTAEIMDKMMIEEQTQEEQAAKEAAKRKSTLTEVPHSVVFSEFPSNVKSVYMQVCIYNELGCFGLGENLKDRYVIAMSPEVEVLCIPRYWLMLRNKGNMWARVIQYLNGQIPTTEEIFQIFVQGRYWGTKKRRLINSLVKKPPCNVVNNVPYSIRLNEDIQYGAIYM